MRTSLENEETNAVKLLNSFNDIIYKSAQERMEVDKNLTLSLLEYQPQADHKQKAVYYVLVVAMKISLWYRMVN